VPKKYLYQNRLLLDNKIKSFNAKDKRISNVLAPIEDSYAVNKKHLDKILNVDLLQEILPLLDPDWIV